MSTDNKSSEFVILRLPLSKDNIHFVYLTFGVTQYVFYDQRFLSAQIKTEHPEKFDEGVYERFREKVLKIKEGCEVSFTVNEFLFFSKIVDFVCKCFIGEPNVKLKVILTNDHQENSEFDYDRERAYYLKKSSKLFEDFRRSCKNKAILDALNRDLAWKIDI